MMYVLYFYVVLPSGLRAAVLICQRTAKAVVFILTKDNNVLVDVYIDDFFGAATVEEALFVYNKLLFLPFKCISKLDFNGLTMVNKGLQCLIINALMINATCTE